MRNIFSSHSKSNNSSTSSPPPPPHHHHHHHHHSFSESLMEENIEIAQALIKKWDSENSNFTKAGCYLFTDNRKEARDFIKSVYDLQTAMHFFVSEHSRSINNAQNLMQLAIKILEKELYQILSTNRGNLDPESISSHASEISRTSSCSDFEDESEDEIQSDSQVVVMSDLRIIAECMISAGYGKECVLIYKITRKSIIDEALYRLGIEAVSGNKVHKLEWDILDFKIKNWVHAVKIAVKTLFSGERFLCDYVFSASDSIRESCFSDITKEAAITLFNFPEIVAKGKKSSQKIFTILDLYDAISQLWPEIESIFSFDSTSIVRSQAVSSLIRLGDAARSMLADFESAIQKDTSRSPVPVPDGAIHPLTRYVMNYISFLSDYSGILSDITADWPLPEPTSLPDSYFENSISEEFSTSAAISIRFAWLVLVLLCKLDGKTEYLKEVSLSYLFLANNLHYVISKVRSSNLKFLLGQDWISKQEMKVKQYCSNYERMGWSKVLSSLPPVENPTVQISVEEAKEYYQTFSSAFESTYRTQSSWVVSDGKLRDEIKVSISNKLVPAYQDFYDRYRGMVTDQMNKEEEEDSSTRFITPDDLGNYLSDLFYHGMTISATSSGGSHSR